MRHHDKNRKFGREKNARVALIKGLAKSLIEHGSIETTLAKAKELRPYVERLFTQAKKGNLAGRRLVLGKLYNNTEVVKKLFARAEKSASRVGGYLRIVRTGTRLSDASPKAKISFVDHL